MCLDRRYAKSLPRMYARVGSVGDLAWLSGDVKDGDMNNSTA